MLTIGMWYGSTLMIHLTFVIVYHTHDTVFDGGFHQPTQQLPQPMRELHGRPPRRPRNIDASRSPSRSMFTRSQLEASTRPDYVQPCFALSPPIRRHWNIWMTMRGNDLRTDRQCLTCD